MADADRGVRLRRQPDGRAHLLGHRSGDVGVALLIFGDDVLEEFEALFAGKHAVSGEGTLRRRDCRVDIGLPAEADPPGDAFGRGVDDVELARACGRGDPCAVDVEVEVVAHGGGSQGFGWVVAEVTVAATSLKRLSGSG